MVSAIERIGDAVSEADLPSAPIDTIAEKEWAPTPTRNGAGDSLLAAVGDSDTDMIDAPDESARHSHAAGADDSSAPELVPPTTELANLAVAELYPPLDAPHAENVEASREGQRTLQGLIDKAIWTSIEGWAWDPKTPRKRIRLELVEDGTQLAMAVAGEDREDLALAGIGDGRHAFRIKLTPGLLSEGRHVLHLRCAETGAIVPGSPVVLESRRSRSGPRSAGTSTGSRTQRSQAGFSCATSRRATASSP